MFELLPPERRGQAAGGHARTSVALRQVAMSSKVKGRSSPGAALAAVAADGLAVAVALLDDHADVGLHELGDVHDLRRRETVYTGQLFDLIVCLLFVHV